MLFHVYGGNALYQWGAMILVLVGLILLNEVARRTKRGGLIIFGAVPVVLTIYFIVIAACAAAGQTWAVENQTHVYMNGWFHYPSRRHKQRQHPKGTDHDGPKHLPASSSHRHLPR